MKIIKSEGFLPIIKGKHLLLDTNVFIDALTKPTVFTEFFNELKQYDVTITTIDFVVVEFLKGAPNEQKNSEKKEFIDQFIDATLPLTQSTIGHLYHLVKLFGVEGKSASITDLMLGAFLMQYRGQLFLMTKNTTDFPSNIFQLMTLVNFPHIRSIQTYGIYSMS